MLAWMARVSGFAHRVRVQALILWVACTRWTHPEVSEKKNWRHPRTSETIEWSCTTSPTQKEDADGKVYRIGCSFNQLHGRGRRCARQATFDTCDRNQWPSADQFHQDASRSHSLMHGGGDAERLARRDSFAACFQTRCRGYQCLARSEERCSRCVWFGGEDAHECAWCDRLQTRWRVWQVATAGEDACDGGARCGAGKESTQSPLSLPWSTSRGQGNLPTEQARRVSRRTPRGHSRRGADSLFTIRPTLRSEGPSRDRDGARVSSTSDHQDTRDCSWSWSDSRGATGFDRRDSRALSYAATVLVLLWLWSCDALVRGLGADPARKVDTRQRATDTRTQLQSQSHAQKSFQRRSDERRHADGRTSTASRLQSLARWRNQAQSRQAHDRSKTRSTHASDVEKERGLRLGKIIPTTEVIACLEECQSIVFRISELRSQNTRETSRNRRTASTVSMDEVHRSVAIERPEVPNIRICVSGVPNEAMAHQRGPDSRMVPTLIVGV